MKHQRQEEVAVNESLFVRIIQMANQRKRYFTVLEALVYTPYIVHPKKSQDVEINSRDIVFEEGTIYVSWEDDAVTIPIIRRVGSNSNKIISSIAR